MSRDQGERQAEAKWLAAKCHFIVDFMVDRVSDPVYAQIAGSFRTGIDAALKKAHVPGLKMAYRDLRQQMLDLSPADQQELDEALQRTFDVDVAREVRDEIIVAQAIIRRGTITNADEYSLLRTYVEQHLTNSDKAHVDRALRLVAEYETAIPDTLGGTDL